MLKKRNNLVLKFRELWNSLHPTEQEQLWDIMTALRGDDKGKNDDVKIATTARIRGEFLGSDSCHRGFTFLSLALVKSYCSSYSSSQILREFKACSSHFKDHVLAAIEALNLYRPKSSMRDLQKFLGDRY